MERYVCAIAVVAVSCTGNSGDGSGKTDPCENETCSGHGECIVTADNRAFCDCERGYDDVGLTCVADCFAVDCGGLGGCIVADGEPQCVCDHNYQGVGLDCRPAPDSCHDELCSGHGQCVEDDEGKPSCICETGYAPVGLSCVPVGCSGVDCSGHGGCLLEAGAPSCRCDFGYEAVGLGCRPGDCALIECGAGSCIGGDDGPRCECDYGHVAVGYECRPEACELEDCSGHGACVEDAETAGGLRCECDVGYVAEGLSCPPACGDLACGEHGACVQEEEDGEARCACDRGYESVGTSCRAVGPPGEEDAGVDSGTEGGVDGGADAGSVEAGLVDGGVDGGSDSGVDGGDGGAEPPLAPGEWVLIPGGTFTMGSPESELGRDTDEGEHEVTLTRSFWMMVTEITQGQFEKAMEYNPSSFSSCGPTCPVEQVNWYEFAAYANALSRAEGLEECYYCTGSVPDVTCEQDGRFFGAATSIYDCAGYRLPTEAEWEYAARGGTTTATYNGDLTTTDCTLSSILDPAGWYCGNASSRTHPVGEKLANAYGLHDMLGNVWEWCHDWYGAYPGGAETDPTGPPSGSYRVLRGGSWNLNARSARAAIRKFSSPGIRG